MSSPEGTPGSVRNQRYHRLPKEELAKDGNVDDEESSSSANVVISSGESSSSSIEGENIFRNPSFKDDETNSVNTGGGGSHLEGTSSANGALHLDDDDDLEDWEDDEAGLRRYHMDFQSPADIPLPAEFSHESFPKRIWQSFLELQAAARQRRAARLLSMQSQSCQYQLHSCLLTWCCDATDRGIVVVAVWLSAWLLIGLAARPMPSTWWWMGIFLFVIRISARRCFEYLQGRQRKRRQRLSTADAVELRNSSVWTDSSGSKHGASSFGEVI